MTRGRKRKHDSTVPKHIDQAKIPNGIYWHRQRQFWYTIYVDGKPRSKKVADKTALLSDLHRIADELSGLDEQTLDYMLERFEQSDKFKNLKESTQDDYRYCRRVVQNFQTKLGVPFSKLNRKRIKRPIVQKLVDELAKGERAGDGSYPKPTPAKANHVLRYLSRTFEWGVNRGYTDQNPAEGVEAATERADPRMPERVTMRAVIALWRRRGCLPTRRKGSLSPYLWAVAEIAYRCRMRNVEVRKLTDADGLSEGLYVDRVKGSRDNVTRWIPALREAWDFLVQRRDRIWAKRRFPKPERASDRPLIVAEDGTRISKEALKSAWARGIEIAVAAKLITETERFGLHGLKHRGITDTAGTPDKKQQASGHVERRMVHRYDHEVPLVEPAGEADENG